MRNHHVTLINKKKTRKQIKLGKHVIFKNKKENQVKFAKKSRDLEKTKKDEKSSNFFTQKVT